MNNTTLLKDLGYAMAKDELELYYQPQINTTTNGIIGFEALLRWKHPTKGMISPAVFIPIAEENNLINDIGQWVLKQQPLKIKNGKIWDYHRCRWLLIYRPLK